MNEKLNKLNTELRNKNTMNIDQGSTEEILRMINNEDKTVALAVEKAIPMITPLVDKVYESLQQGGRVFYMGAGTSGRLGVLDASECPPTFGVDHLLFQGIMAGGPEAMYKAKEGAEDSLTLGVEDLKERGLTSKDTVIGLAASGRTPYVIGALDYANSIGATTGSVTCVEGSEISKHAKYPVEVVPGAEALTGSTRMKAGTSQKLVLNMISTTSMILYGKVFQNMMVDVQPTNEKLVKRAINIIKESIEVDETKAEELFYASGKSVKIAIIMGLTGKSKEDAQEVLNSSSGNVSKTVHSLIDAK